jgi:recombination protein RecR
MERAIPKALAELIEQISQLPGVGPRSAERYAYHLLRTATDKNQALADSIANLHDRIAYCPKTFALIESGEKVSPLYSDPKRNRRIVAVVAEPFDIVAIEKTRTFSGTYHVLGGLVSPIDNIGPEQLKIPQLMKRLDEDKVKELILAINSSVEGESTALLITQQIRKRPVRVTRLARGLPVGVDLEYADQLTLTRALEGRQTF